VTIGLLQCDHVPRDLVDAAGGDYDDLFRRRFPKLDLRIYDASSGELPADVDECDGYLTSGSRHSVYDDIEWIHALAATVRTIRVSRIPFVGICFGHQMIAHALGGIVRRSPRGWGVGIHEMHVSHPQVWMQPPLESPRIYLSCQDQIEQLPAGTQTLATGTVVEISMIMLYDMLGIAGHPEFTRDYAEALYELRRVRIGDSAAGAAFASLDDGDDADLVAEWITNFLIR